MDTSSLMEQILSSDNLNRAYVGMFALFNRAKELVTGAIKKNLEYSGSLTDIRKVSGLTMEEINKLSTELAKIDTRTSVDGLAQLAYQGAKLGMSKYGVEGMASFVRAADKINVALGEELGEEALPALSKMVEVMGLIPKMGIEKAIYWCHRQWVFKSYRGTLI